MLKSKSINLVGILLILFSIGCADKFEAQFSKSLQKADKSESYAEFKRNQDEFVGLISNGLFSKKEICNSLSNLDSGTLLGLEADKLIDQSGRSFPCYELISSRIEGNLSHQVKQMNVRTSSLGDTNRAWGPAREIYISSKYSKGIGGTKPGHQVVDELRDGEVVLTFDDGPYMNSYGSKNSKYYNQKTTQKVLQVLKKENTQAVFFIEGRKMARRVNGVIKENYYHKFNDLSLLNIREGELNPYRDHVIGLHSWSHPNYTTLSLRSALRETKSVAKAVDELFGVESLFFRFPFGAYKRANLRQINEQGVVSVLWDVDSNDWRLKGKQWKKLTNNILSGLKKTARDQGLEKGKGIILLHDTKRVTALFLDVLIQTLKSKGYKPAIIKHD